MHVAVYSEHFHKNPSGPRLSAIQISKALLRLGARVTVLNLSRHNGLEPVDGIGDVVHAKHSWKVLPVRYGRHRFCARQLHALHRRDPVDCVLAMGTWVGAGAALFKRKCGVPFVLNPRSRIAHKPGNWKYDHDVAVVKACGAFVGISETEVQGWCQATGVPRDGRFSAVHNGFDPTVLDGDTEALPGVPTDQPVILCMAMLRKSKGQHRLMQALDTMDDLPWFCVMAGGGRDHEQAWVKERFASMKLKHRVLLPGTVTGARWRWLYHHASIFCLAPVYPEAFGNAFVEAQAAGLPVVTSNRGGQTEVVGPESAILVPRGDDMTPALAAALRKLLGDAELRKRMGDAGRERAKLFTWDNAGRGYQRAIEYAITHAGESHG
ncbi:MAG: glycosyltransferase family 4 protein [Planctomycetes bacterium]|nr:glycosyltransferase family 4 protein [Planctomycetota bacterium]MCW8137225.1 glycosyltransferase family 4 protein [Planctomycetota bacterium]